jgi:hypothetical protein
MTIAPAPAAVVENPTETIPAPDSETLESVCVVDEVAAVVFPIANWFCMTPLAAVVAPDMTSAPAPAAVVENPTETPPAPEIEMLESVCVVELVAAVVFPVTN